MERNNFPSKTILERETDSEYITTFTAVTTFRYETATDGYPVKIYVQINNNSKELKEVIEYED